MIRIEFSADDIARTRIAATPDPYAETVLGVGALRMARPERIAVPWRRTSDRVTAELAAFLNPRGPVQVDLFTPAGTAADFGTAADRLLGVPDETFSAEIAALYRRGLRSPAWLDGIGRAELPARKRLAGALRRAHDRYVEPYWPSMRAVLDAERTRLRRLLADGGVEGLLSGFHPLAHWRSGALDLPTAGRWTRLPLSGRLGGRGIVLTPSVLCAVGPVPFFPYDESGPAVLYYPVALDPVAQARLWAGAVPDGSSPLATLLGRTRAAALAVIADGCTTTELARRLGVSAGNASQHAAALRGAGLVASRRDANRMLHSVTALGAQLLEAS